MVPCGFIFLFTPPAISEFHGGWCSPARSVVLPAPAVHLVVLLLLFLRGWCLALGFQLLRGRGNSTGGTSRLRGFLACGVKPSVGWALQQTPAPTRLGPASLGSPCSSQTRQLFQARPRSDQGELCCSGEASCPAPRSRATCDTGAAVLGPALMPSGLSLHTRGSGPGLHSPPWCCHLPSNNPWTPTSRSPSLPGPPRLGVSHWWAWRPVWCVCTLEEVF